MATTAEQIASLRAALARTSVSDRLADGRASEGLSESELRARLAYFEGLAAAEAGTPRTRRLRLLFDKGLC